MTTTNVSSASIATRTFPATTARTVATSAARAGREQPLPHLESVDHDAWSALASNALEPNAHFMPRWAQAVNRSARDRGDVRVLTAAPANPFESVARRINGLLPVISLWRAYRLPFPALVSADPYCDLGTPLLDRNDPAAAAEQMMERARDAGAAVIILRNLPLEGLAANAFRTAMARQDLAPTILSQHHRAALDATIPYDQLMASYSGSRRKTLRKMQKQLEEAGKVSVRRARTPAEVADALPVFLRLEASGWKSQRGTALQDDAGDLAFIQEAASGMAANSTCEIVTLMCGDAPVASCILLRHQDRMFCFKIGIDETFARFGPGVQLLGKITELFCNDPDITLADSTAIPGHSLMEGYWPGRMLVGDMMVPLYRDDAMANAIRLGITARKALRETIRSFIERIRPRAAR